jgi:hypothetical protein
MRTTIKIFIVLVSIYTLSLFSHTEKYKYKVYNLITDMPEDNYSIERPCTAIIFFPFVTLSYHLLSTKAYPHYYLQILSWIMFFAGISIFFSIIRKKNILFSTKIILSLIFIYINFLLTIIFFPLPSPKIKPKTTKDEIEIVDFHSHSCFSWDGIPSIEENISWHKHSGFTKFYLTDHDVLKKEEVIKFKNTGISPGIEIQLEGLHFLILDVFDAKSILSAQNVKDLITTVHENKGKIYVAEYWRDKKKRETFSIEELIELGVDGFEIYNPGHPDVSKNIKDEIIKLSLKNKKLLFAGTNWHGWGKINFVWNVFSKDTKECIPLIYTRKEMYNTPRLLLDPLFFAYYTLRSMNFYEFVSLTIWTFIILSISLQKRLKQYFLLALLAAFTLFFYYLSTSYYGLYLQYKNYNAILPLLSKCYLILSIVNLLIFIIFSYRVLSIKEFFQT